LERGRFLLYVKKTGAGYQDYGKVGESGQDWTMTNKKLGNAKFMHCLPVSRNVVVADEVWME